MGNVRDGRSSSRERALIDTAIFVTSPPDWESAASAQWPTLLGPPLRGSLARAVTTCALHPWSVLVCLRRGATTREVLKAALLRETAAVLGLSDLRAPSGAASAVAALLPPARAPRVAAPTRITVAMMVQDEEQRLPTALASIEGLASELVIVDGGSSDATPEIARSAGAVVVTELFTGDFARQRNVSLALATSPWVLVLDADERIEQELAELIRDVLPRLGRTRVVHVPRFNLLDDQPGRPYAWPDPQARLFRRGLRYRGKLHERVRSRGRRVYLPITGPYIAHTKSRLEHYKDELRYQALDPRQTYDADYLRQIRAAVDADSRRAAPGRRDPGGDAST